MKIGLIGAGKVGCTLGKFLALGNVQIGGYYSRSPKSAQAAALFTNAKHYDTIEHLTKECDAIFITVPDQSIRSVYEQVCKYEIQNKFICHCSGALASRDVFPDIGEKGAHGFSIHPLFPISTKYKSYRELTGAFFCTEGDEAGLNIFEPILTELGATAVRIAPEVKSRYHAACVIASNFMCGLIQQSMELMCSCGFSEALAMQALSPLIEKNLAHLLNFGPREALTGPIERCDLGTVDKHLGILEGEDRALYCLLSKRLCTLASEKNPNRDYTAMLELLAGGKKES
jgi:predicted short-subunit dehydrogenase-like oxidoreductase (DUF2520 family)